METIFGLHIDEKHSKALNLILYYISGTFCPILSNLLQRNYYPFKNGLYINFQKPWFITWGSFLGSTLVMIPLTIRRNQLSTKSNPNIINWRLFRSCAIPGLCLIFATVLDQAALSYLSPAMYQCVHSFSLIFSTLIDGAFSYKRSLVIDWTALFCVFLGIATGGCSVLAREAYLFNAGSKPFFAILYLIIAQAIHAAKAYYEETSIREDDNNPYSMHFLESLWGFYLISFFFLPLVSITSPSFGTGLYEDTIESFAICFSNVSTAFIFIAFILVSLIYDICNIWIVGTYGAVEMTNYSAVLPICVWPIGVIMNIIADNDEVGEYVNWLTFVELLGFAILIVGSLLLSRTIRIPFFNYESQQENGPSTACEEGIQMDDIHDNEEDKNDQQP